MKTKLFNKILIANRGEIAIRVMRTCAKMGIGTVAVYSTADQNALFVQIADEAVHIAGFQAADSYLDHDKIIAAAQLSNADAIHPGYGFLSENASFALRCAAEGIVFIGPNPEAIAAMGSKIRAKEIMQQQDVPVIPGYKGAVQDTETLREQAVQIGFPVLLKASAGGGGKGMRIVHNEQDLPKAADAAKREALAAFGDDTLLIEKYFESVRHIEFQIMGDQHGNVVHCYERECSIQRRYQKVIEETPSPALTPELRKQMGAAAVAAGQAINYDNAGTVEFILTPEGKFYFLEVNTRLQVEHPVTEMTTGLDLVQLQIEVAQGMPLPFRQQDLHQIGHAIECRIYAEDAANNFMPATGTIQLWQAGKTTGIRYDTGVQTSSVIDIYYDPMIAKIIAHASTRLEAIQKMKRALQELTLLGITSNKDFLVRILQNTHFVAGDIDTHFLDKKFHYQAITFSPRQLHYFAIAALVYDWQKRNKTRSQLRHIPSGWRNNFYAPQQSVFQYGKTEVECSYRLQGQQFSISIADKEQNYTAQLIAYNAEQNELVALINNHRLKFVVADAGDRLHLQQTGQGDITLGIVSPFPEQAEDEVKGGYRSPMPGEVVKVLVEAGDEVKAGEGLLVLSSMKMENLIEAYEDGTIEEIYVSEKAFVEADTLLLKMK